MEDDDFPISLDDQAGLSDMDKQRATLQTYLNALPYECESVEYMQTRLEEIVGKIFISAKAQNWLVLTTWDGMLQCWLLMRYPLPKSTRAKLVRFYYELCILPGIESRVIRSWADMLSRLLANKSGVTRKLESTDLELPWQPLWDALQKELWPKKRIQEPTRNVVNILLYVAEQCKGYYPVTDIPDMLSTFVPRITKESIMTMVPVMTSFLPPGRIDLYLPTIFVLWEAFNSFTVDDRLIELAGDLSEEHVAGAAKKDGAKWRDVGIWSESEWTTLIGKGLGSMNVPVGAIGGASVSAMADIHGDMQSLRIKKSVNRQSALAKIIVYSMSVDGPERTTTAGTPAGDSRSLPSHSNGYLAGSKALDSLEKLITCTESFFHPSNSGAWSLSLTTFLHRLTAEFIRRVKEEEQPSCIIPQAQRLTPAIRRNFVRILRTPALIAMFSKDPVAASYAQGSLRTMALLNPDLIMPELLERAYGGLEVVNETHRTTAVLGMLSGICVPLTTERVWLGGQKHLVPLLELCIPGIDLNDPVKTVCATMFIVSAVQHVRIGELSYNSGLPVDSEDPADAMEIDTDAPPFPGGIDVGEVQKLSRSEERSLTIDSTAGFADWVASLFRRVFALFENLPEEGGRRNTTGGKQEESVLKSIKSMLDVVCLHLSDKLFDLVLNLVYNYATTNAKSNAVRAFGQLVACLARVKPKETIAKFFSHCNMQIEEELKHGASSVRTTSSHTAVPSDTTFHWNLTILRGCLGYGGPELLRYKPQILQLFALLVDKTKGERGYTGVGRLIMRALHTLVGTYPLNSRFINTAEWEDPNFDTEHYKSWGKLYEANEVRIEWHVPSSEEIAFAIEILDTVLSPAMDKVDALIESAPRWDSIERNDFCRYLHACKAIWNGLPTLLEEGQKEVANSGLYDEIESMELSMIPLSLNAGFVLTDPKDPRYQHVSALRGRFATIIKKASSTLRQRTEGEDHTDAVIGVVKAIDSYLLDYGLNRGTYESLSTSYSQARDLHRTWPKQKENSRLVFVKRAQVYHSGRVYMHSLYRKRSAIDNGLIEELVELSLSPYTRIRRQAQSVLHNVCGYYVRSTRMILPHLFNALAKGNDPDRMKGALYVLGNKGIAAYSLADYKYRQKHLLTLLECQHEEKPSVQKLVSSLSQELLAHLSEEAFHTEAYTLDTPRLNDVLLELAAEFSASFVNQQLLSEATAKSSIRVAKRAVLYQSTVTSILNVVMSPQTHWRYVQTALRFLVGLVRRDVPTSADLAKLFMELCTNPQPSIRATAQRAVNKMLAMVKIRSYSKSNEELWRDSWSSPLRRTVLIKDPQAFLAGLEQPLQGQGSEILVDRVPTGFVSWAPTVKGYAIATGNSSPLLWSADCQPCLDATKAVIVEGKFFVNLATLWGQESGRTSGITELRIENVMLIKALAIVLERECLDGLLDVIEPLIFDPDRFKQRAGVEFLAGLLRGSKHWLPSSSDRLWSWLMSRLDRIYAQIKPDTLVLWESLFSYQLQDRDPRRSTPLIKWVLDQPLDFTRESAFEMTKQITLFSAIVDCLGSRFNSLSDKYITLFMDNLDIGYAEIRAYIAEQLHMMNRNLWEPCYPSTQAFLQACQTSKDPLQIRQPTYAVAFNAIVDKMPQWRTERFPPPRVSQSQYDKVGLTLLQWIWTSAHGAQASLIFPYAIRLLPEILRMAELSDSPDLQRYSTAVLYVISAITPPSEYVEVILTDFVDAIKSSASWRIRLHALPAMVVFFYRNLLSISFENVSKIMDCLLACLADENVEVRGMASKALSGIVRCSQRQSIVPLKNRFTQQIRKTKLPDRQSPKFADSLRTLHSAILGVCALIESFPYSVESWMPPLAEVLAPHSTDPPPISTTIRQCASEFKKTHQDTWHKDQLAFDEDQLQSLSSMLVGTSYYA
ncbi:BLM10 family protein [Pleurotus pulmonarius]